MDRAKLNFTPTIAGVWKYVDDGYVSASNSGILASSFFGNVRLGSAQLTGVVMTGWNYSGFDNTAASVVPVNLGILEQQPDGTLLLDTSSYVDTAATRGGGSVVVADFNADGRDDVFLAAHNESPFLRQPSTVLLSNAQATFTKVTLPDAVMAHDAQLAHVDGQPVVITASFTEDGQPFTSPTYAWNGSGFTLTDGALRTQTAATGMSVALADFDGNGDQELVIGDLITGPGVPFQDNWKFRIALYDWTGGDIVGDAPRALITPYFEARSAYQDVASQWGPANTHSFRVWVDDFNHDGRPDIVAGQSLWTQANTDWPTMLQMLQNNGDFQFADVSDTLNAGFDKGLNEIDYNMQRVDLDGSGILSYLSARNAPSEFDGQQWVPRDDRQGNFLLVNDGTGRMHMALHEEFVAIGDQALAYAGSIYDDTQLLYVDPHQPTPKLHGYQDAAGRLNFVAEVGSYRVTDGVAHGNASVLVNVPLQIDLRTDFTDPITISDRNGSMLMRTFAGDDTIHDVNANSSASFDAGLGLDTAVYSMARGAYTVAAAGDAYTVSRPGFADVLRNVERLRFTDTKVALDLDGAAGTVAQIIGAVFGAAMLTPEYVGVGLAMADAGSSAEALAQLALQVRFGGVAGNAAVVDVLYSNLFGHAPTQSERDHFAGWLDSGTYSQAALVVLAGAHELNLGRIGYDALVAQGLAYG